MVTRKSQFSSAAAEKQTRLEHDAQLAGMAAAFGRIGELGPQVLALQQAVLSGIASAQRREAKRLAALHGEDEPRLAGAQARAERFEALHAELAAGSEVARQFVSTFQSDGVFHGYVMKADGTGAEAYVVQLEFLRAEQKELEPGRAQTDASGYFRIDLGAWKRERRQAAPEPGRWAERFAQMAAMEGFAAEPPAGEAAPRAAAQVASETAYETSVRVFDPNGRLVFDDPMPPTFDDGTSEFRFYVLPEGRT